MFELLFHGTSLGETNDLVQILEISLIKRLFQLRLNVRNGTPGQQVYRSHSSALA